MARLGDEVGMRTFKCPACGFSILNRRVSACESCAAPIPAELLYSQEEIAQADAEHAHILAQSKARRRKEQARFYNHGGADVGFLGDGSSSEMGADCGGDGGGGCD